MLNIELLQKLLIISIIMSTITCAFVQKSKKYFPCSSCLAIYSLIINIIIGILFCITFTNIEFPESLWVGLFSFLGADTIYKSLEGNLSSYSQIISKDTIQVKKENIIKTDGDI